ncbi:glycosyltransferase family 4 protein [Sporosarcina oncorhynchi]|uniref:Glycosyltransferase family 4 protein n=1 Tax=Sporosarcina oncorhynchi TaxID=3056444 RepID=A0ABZ0L2S2_9BACL|nr:glycosyltransferase family 4 protein [Sporosarcina sp. T2O-4]WOV86474.1 glycosyltransferase family 4 protein [Sporosarcina sp. T2O-4]
MKKDVAILCQYFYPEYISSATLPTELAIGLQQRGLSVGVVTGYPKNYVKSNLDKVLMNEKYKDVTIHRVKYTTLNNKTKVGRIVNFFTFFIAVLLKVFFLRRFKTIIVYSNPPILPIIPYYMKKMFGTKFIFVVFDIYPDSALKSNSIKVNGLIHKIMNFINHRTYKKADKIILLGNEMKEYVIQEELAVTEKNLAVIPNWYSNEEYIATDEIANYEYLHLREQFSFIILYSGNMGTFQDMETIQYALFHFRNQTDILFVFCGHGNKVENLKEFIKENEIPNVKVYGFLIDSSYADVLKISDICIVSLAKGTEGLGVPSKTYGYLAAGKPVIAIMDNHTDIAKSIITANCGRSILQGDHERLITVINNYRNSHDIRKTHSTNAKNLYLSTYSKEKGIEKYLHEIESVVTTTDGSEKYVHE